MKIAFITDDGKTISQHFGRAAHYLVLDLADRQIVGRELRDKLGHNHFVQPGEGPDHNHGSGLTAASHKKHGQMSEVISDCEVLICGGMGRGAYESMLAFGIKPLVTDQMEIEEALQLYLEGKLKDQTEKLH
jgi:predicted Fe-Mo cluster-binding NifX family protein